MAGIQLTTEMAQGAAVLAGQGETIDVWMPVKGGGMRFCHLRGCDETGETVTLRCYVGNEAAPRSADVQTRLVLIAPFTAKRCLLAWARSQETAGAREGRRASRATQEINVELWLAHRNKARRDPSGRYVGHHVEPAGRY